MSTGPDGGGGGRRFFLSAHRCPEVDLLPHDSGTEIPSPCSLVPSVQIPEFTCTGQSDANYLDISNCPEEEEEEREEEGSISDWSEEDLSLHFSPSVILPSGDEDSDPESSFECVDITVIKGQEGEGLKMVPKRQIQLKKKKDAENVINKEKTKKLQVIVKDEPAEARVPNSEMSTDELLHPIIPHRPDVLLRQHSMPASLHSPSTDVNSIRAYKGLVTGACQGVHVGGNSRQRLQKSFSLDETKTKMASCIIKNVLSKKMQVEQDNSKTSYLHKKPAGLQTADQRRVREGEEDKTGGGVFKAPVHVVRDMRSLIKNTYSLSFSRAPTRTPDNKPTGFKVIGQEESPPPTYQQAVGVKAPHETERRHQSSTCSRSSGGHTIKVTTSLSQSWDRKQSNRFICPIIQQRRGSEPIINRDKVEDAARSAVMLDPPTHSRANHEPSELNQAEGNRGVTHQVRSSVPLSVVIQPPPQPSSTSRHNTVAQPLLCTQEQSSNLGVSSQFAPSSSQQILHSCFYTPTALPAFTVTLSHHTGRVSYVQSPMSYIQTQVCPPPPIPTIHLLSRSEESQSRSKGKTSDQPDNFRTTGVQTSDSKGSVTPSTQEHHERKHQPQLQQQFHGFLPAHMGSNSLGEDSSAVPGALLSKPALSHVMLDPKCGRCYFMDMPPQPHGKLLLDPETGQYVQVFLPGTSFTPSTSVVPVRCVTPAPFIPSVMNATPTILSVMQFQPMVAVSSLYAPPCLPLTIHTPSVNYTHTTP